MPSLHVFTSAAVNYLPKVRTLCHSIRRHHPEAVIHLALADALPPWLDTAKEPFDHVMPLAELGIPDWKPWSFMHDIVELSTAIKPFALKKLLSLEGCRQVLYFDPDMVLFSRVDDILARLEHGNVALTPHQTTPETDPQAVVDNEITSLKMGVFNLGFVGVANTPEGHRFADWWAARIYRYCRADVPNGLFTDQKWINFAPIFFQGVEIVRESRHNVATWNLTTRNMTGSVAEGFRVDGAPLGFYHFTGFDSGAHRIMAIKNAPGNAAVHELIRWYEGETSPGREDPVSRTPWAFATFDDGTPIRREHRMLYRDYQDLPKAFPDPYSTQGTGMSFLEWCDTEGRVRFPQYFTPDPVRTLSAAEGIPPGMALRLAALLFAPRGGRLLRQRVGRVLRHEGVGGIARRVKRSLQASP